jgi:hypothetical protein
VKELEKKVKFKEVKEAVEKVLDIAPDLDIGEVYLALLKKYPYSIIEIIMNKRIEGAIMKLKESEINIKIVDDSGKEVLLEDFINDKEQEKQN